VDNNEMQVMHWNNPEWEKHRPWWQRLWQRLRPQRRPPARAVVVAPGMPSPPERVLHCWEPGPDRYVYTDDPHACGTYVCPGVRAISTLCLLPDGHEGPHQWTNADEVIVSPTDAEAHDCEGARFA
jgi:hypothetical protein